MRSVRRSNRICELQLQVMGGVMNLRLSAAIAAIVICLPTTFAFAQKDPGVRGGLNNTGGGLQAQGIPLPRPPVISPNPTTGDPIRANELASFNEGIIRAGQLESTCDECAMVTDGSPAPVNPINGLKELDPLFPQFTTNSNGLGARHNSDQCFSCHAHPGLGGSGGFLVPNPMRTCCLGAHRKIIRATRKRWLSTPKTKTRP